MPMYSLQLFSASEYSPLAKSLKKKAFMLMNGLGFGDYGQAKSSKEGGEIQYKSEVEIKAKEEILPKSFC